MKHARSLAGFTLTELIVVLSVASILAVFAIPTGLDWWRRETVVILAERFASTVSLAQSMSRNQHVWVHIAPLDGTEDWKSGWTLQTSTSERQDTPDAEHVLMTVSPPVFPPVDIRFRGTGGANTLSYSPVGYSQNNNSLISGTLNITSGKHVRRVKINLAGRARICDPDKDESACPPGASGDDAT